MRFLCFPYLTQELSERSPYLAAASRMAVYETRKVRLLSVCFAIVLRLFCPQVLKRFHMVPDQREHKDTTRHNTHDPFLNHRS